MAMMQSFIQHDFSFNDMVTQGWPYRYKIDPFKLKRANEKFVFYPQLEIDFGKEFEVSYEAKQSRFDVRREIVTCVMCQKERELFDRLPFEYNGMDIILSPYSDVYGEVCVDCFHKHDGWEIIKLSDRRAIIQNDIKDSRTISGQRVVLVEKIGHILLEGKLAYATR